MAEWRKGKQHLTFSLMVNVKKYGTGTMYFTATNIS